MKIEKHCKCAAVLFFLLGLSALAIGIFMTIPLLLSFRASVVSDGSSIEGAVLAVLCAMGIVMLYLGFLDLRIALSHFRMANGKSIQLRMSDIVGVMVVQFPWGTACGAYALFIQRKREWPNYRIMRP